MAEENTSNVEARVMRALEPLVTSEDVALRRVFARAFDYAYLETRVPSSFDDGSGGSPITFVIDRQAVFNAILADGMLISQPRTSSLWLVQWLDSQGINLERLLTGGGRERHKEVLPDATVVASESMRTKVLPAARQLASETTGTDQPSLRHVNFALFTMWPPEWPAPMFTAELQGRLREAFVARNAELYPNEAIGWKRQIANAVPQDVDEPGETVRTLPDSPAMVDGLGRLTFAEVLGARIREVSKGLRTAKKSTDRAFILHMDGPWGSGKSSVLNFLKTDLERDGWLVVEFNAWRNQHRSPAWLPLILEVRRAALWKTSWSALSVWTVWLWWRLRMDWMPYLLAILLISVAGFLAWWAGVGTVTNPLQNAGEAFKALGAIVATIISVLAMARGFSLGSHRNAETYLESKSEPFRRIVRLFEWLVWANYRPVAVFVDDLDRCDSIYVTDLLEGVQTSLRAAPIVYVVAGDRKWISSSFERRYANFLGEIGTPGRPLGYLFLDKVFQLSTSLPQLSAQRQAEYWRQLLERSDVAAPEDLQRERQRLEAKAAADLKGKTKQEDIQVEIDKTKKGSIERETLLAAAAKQTATPEALRAAEHRLQSFAHLLEANPRSMKRLVNSYGLNQARAYLENRNVSVEALARWTIIELRWPLLADHVVRSWPEIDLTTAPSRPDPDEIDRLLGSREVRQVIGAARAKGRLTRKNLRPILD